MGFLATPAESRGFLNISPLVRAPAGILAAILAILSVAGPAAGPKASSAGEAKAADVPSVPADNMCGVNSLFMLLRSWGYKISPREIRQVITPGPDGSSMEDLREAAKALGVDVRVFRCDVEDLGRDCVIPAVAYMKPEAGLSQAARKYRGHFVLIFRVDPGPQGLVHWYDGTQGFMFNRPKDEFIRWWTGYVLSRQQEAWSSRTLLWVTMAHGVFWLAVSLCFLRSRRPGAKDPVCDRESIRHVDEPSIVGQGG